MEQGTNKSYRIRTEINKDSNVIVNFTQEYETFELLSIKLKTENLYRLHNANYGIVVGRVQANGGFGVPNAKISIFIEADQENENSELLAIYGYTDVFQTNSLGNTYNLLPDEQVSDCHKKIGAFPNKRYLLDNDTYIEVYDKYYKYTTRTNNAGDYIIVGVPIGNQTLHMDLDLSDCGILSQRPRDFVYKGYNIEQFDNPNQFKSETGASINFLNQYVQQTKTIYVNPLWGNNDLGETLGITRADVDVNFKFEPTCVFMGSVVSDSKSNGVSLKCVPTDQMGVMDELTTGKGTIEMIRKTPTNGVEEFQIKGNELIDGNGTWCYQIPMNLDYVTTNEYGETVATDNPNIGIPTRARVRFRVSLDNFEDSNDNYFAGKILVPNNPGVVNENGRDVIDYDYAFGTETGEDSYRDLFWNNVYSVKQHIPRIQKSGSWRTDRFTGIKQCNFYGQNNPIPYNSIRIKLPFMFVVLCAIIKTYVRIVSFLNAIINAIFEIINVFIRVLAILVMVLYPVLGVIYGILKGIQAILSIFGARLNLEGFDDIMALNIRNWSVTKKAKSMAYVTIADGICPDLETWYFAPMIGNLPYCAESTLNVGSLINDKLNICKQTIEKISDGKNEYEDKTSTDYLNKDSGVEEKICITRNIDYLMTCIEMNLAQEYKVIKFDFYNDWINGMLYIPRWKFRPEHKITFLFGLIKFKVRTKGCFDDKSIFGRTRWLTQHCSLGYKETTFNGAYKGYATIGTTNGCSDDEKKQKCHKTPGIRSTAVFGGNGGMIHRETTMIGQSVYYYKPSEMSSNLNGEQTKINMFATDIVLLGSLKDCDENGIPQAFKWLSSSSYKMPTNLALTNLDESGVVFVDDGSYCVGGNDGNKIETREIGIAENSFSGQVQWSSSAPVEIQIMGYEKSPNSVGEIVKISSDRIALTEAAGISWDYTGPSQAERENNDLFSPGGHFLGMSCVNSKTNIKSCVNLQRICEAGATMSERIERTRGFKVDGDGNYTQQSVVFSPNGLISTDEIIAGSFRNMFATMNLSHLIATKKDKNTGYLTYDFSYVRANGFDGSSYKNLVAKSNNYNRNIEEYIPDNYVYDTGDNTISYDIDEDERKNTYHRAIEATNFGYYRFRFGLKESNAKKFNKLAKTKYALTLNGLKYLPQYENSFYFYFGLKEGNTAIDRFYSDFFSMCQTRKKGKNPSFSVKDSGMDYCTKEQSVWVTSEEVEYPYNITLTNGEVTITANGITYKSVQICGLVPGIWEINVSDSDGFSVTKKIKIGANIKGINYTFNDFKENLNSGGKQKYVLSDNGTFCRPKSFSTECIRPKGGEFTFNISDITVFGEGISSLVDEKNIVQNAGLLFVSSSDNSPSTSEYAVMLQYEGDKEFSWTTFNSGDFYNSSVTGNDDKDRHRTDFEFGENKVKGLGLGAVKVDNAKHDVTFYLWQDKKYYTLYFIYKCNNGADSKYLALELCKVYSVGYEAFNLYLGSKFLKYNGENEETFSLSEFLNTNISSNNVLSSIKDDGKNIITKWALRQALYDQRYDITINSSDRLIRCTNLKGQYVDGISFGQPEKAVTDDGVVSYTAFTNYYGTVLSTDDYAFYRGFEVDDTASLLPSISYVPGEDLKLPYFKMSFDSDYNSILSDPISTIRVDAIETGDTVENFAILKCGNFLNIFRNGRGYILKSKSDENLIIECSFIGQGTSGFVVPMSTLSEKGVDINTQIKFKSFDVHPTLCVPIIHRPFYFDAHPFILGRFTAIGKSTLTNSITFDSEKEDYQFICNNIGGTSVKFNLTYGDRKLNYRLKRDSSKENCAYINDYIKIYGGNACAPDYYLGDCTHFGVKLSDTGISIKSTITGSPLDAKQYIEGVYAYAPENGQPDTIDISISTGIPTLDENKERDKKIIQDLTAFTDGDMKGLQFSTSHSLDNFLPKEVVIRREKIEKDGASEDALIDEERYLDVGDVDTVAADDVNKNVKLYMIVMPDKKANGVDTKIGEAMSTRLFNEEILNSRFITPSYYGDALINAVYPSGKTSVDLFGNITFSDYFSNPSAVAFLFDQIIQSSVFSCYSSYSGDVYYRKNCTDLIAGKQRGGYFHKPNIDGYRDPGLVFGELKTEIKSFSLVKYSFNLITPFNKADTPIYKSFDGVHYEDGEDLETPINSNNMYSKIGGIGSTKNADIGYCLTEVKHWSTVRTLSEGKSLKDLINETNLCKNLSKFGYAIGLNNKFDDTDYSSSTNSLYALGDALNERFGVNFKSENEQMAKMKNFYSGFCENSNSMLSGRCCVGRLRCTPITNVWFDEIIGKNWAFPNLEYTVDKTNVNDVSGTYKNFSESIESEYDRVYNINKNKSEGATIETPNYAGIIASFFIDNGFNTNGKSEADTLSELFVGAASGKYESFIVPITLGKNIDENGNIKSSFNWPFGAEYVEKLGVYRDKKWVVNADTEWALGHKNGDKEIASSIEDSIYDENMSYGFRSVIIGVYDGPGIINEEDKNGNRIRPFKIYTFHSKGLDSSRNYDSKFSSSHELNDEFNPNEYYNKRKDKNDTEKTKQQKDKLNLYYYHKYENDYDNYASGWC